MCLVMKYSCMFFVLNLVPGPESWSVYYNLDIKETNLPQQLLCVCPSITCELHDRFASIGELGRTTRMFLARF